MTRLNPDRELAGKSLSAMSALAESHPDLVARLHDGDSLESGDWVSEIFSRMNTKIKRGGLEFLAAADAFVNNWRTSADRDRGASESQMHRIRQALAGKSRREIDALIEYLRLAPSPSESRTGAAVNEGSNVEAKAPGTNGTIGQATSARRDLANAIGLV